MGQADGHGNAVYCKDPLDNLLLRQVVDETTNPLWNSAKHAKVIDLTAQVLCEDLQSPATSGMQFRLDWWTEARNGINDPAQLPTPDGWSDWVTINFADIPNYQPFTWLTINPFNVNKTLFANFQPRWVFGGSSTHSGHG